MTITMTMMMMIMTVPIQQEKNAVTTPVMQR
jgi:hypothetical protein